MNYKYGFNNSHFIVDRNNSDAINLYQEHEYLFNKDLSKAIATCIYKYIQVTDFTYKEKYKRQLKEDYEYLKEIIGRR